MCQVVTIHTFQLTELNVAIMEDKVLEKRNFQEIDQSILNTYKK